MLLVAQKVRRLPLASACPGSQVLHGSVLSIASMWRMSRMSHLELLHDAIILSSPRLSRMGFLQILGHPSVQFHSNVFLRIV